MALFRLRLLGGFALEDSTGAAVALPKRRAAAVLAVLAVCGELGCTRERLLALLWPESDEAGARHGLRDALHALRRVLGSTAVEGGGSLLRLDAVVLVSDTAVFARAVSAGRPADAVSSYGGPLLDGFHADEAGEFERWLDGERTRLAREYGEALAHLAAAAEHHGGWGEAARWWARAVEHDPANSHLALRRAHALAALGDRANAIGALEAHVTRLREDFELEPDPEVVATIARIRRGDLAPPPPTHPTAAVAQPPVELLPPPEPPAPTTSAAPVVHVAGRSPIPRWLPWAAALAALLLGGAYGFNRLAHAGSGAVAARTAVAVLPFRMLDADSSHEYFADGLHDELLTQLAKVAALRVVGRTSVRGYEATSKPLPQIGRELGVGSIVEASVQVIGQRLRVNVQLVDPVTEAALWSERYDRSLDDAFAVQSDIARRIVAAVGATLTRAEAGAIAQAPTRNASAYDFYLQGLAYDRRPGALRENLLVAQQLFERAVGLDAGFALAHAALARVHFEMFALRYDPSPARMALTTSEAALAMRLGPTLPEVRLAAGLHDLADRAYPEALEEFTRGAEGAPNDAELWAWIGRTHLQLGAWDSAFAAFRRARTLDPRDANLLHSMGDTYHFLRRYSEAVEAYRQEIMLAPDVVQPRLSRAWSFFLWKGELDTLHAVLRDLMLNTEPGLGGASITFQRLMLHYWERQPDSVLSLARLQFPATDTSLTTAIAWTYWSGRGHRLLGDSAAARSAFDSAATLLQRSERISPADPALHVQRGDALAALGRRAEALREVDWLQRFDLSNSDRYCSGFGADEARILSVLGETGAALTLLERELARPSLFSVHELRIDPDFDSIRHDERYQALMRKYLAPAT